MRYRIRCAGKALLLVAAIGVFGWAVMMLWNWLIPSLFIGAPSIDFAHALGFLLLSRLLFGRFSGHGGWRESRRWHKLAAMKPEERKGFYAVWRSSGARGKEE